MNSPTAVTPVTPQCCRRSERCSHRIRFHLTVRTDVAPKFELPNCTLRLKRSWAKVFHPADMAQTLEFHTAFRNVSPRRPAWNSNIQRWHTNQTPPFNYGTVPPLFLGRFDTWVFFFWITPWKEIEPKWGRPCIILKKMYRFYLPRLSTSCIYSPPALYSSPFVLIGSHVTIWYLPHRLTAWSL